MRSNDLNSKQCWLNPLFLAFVFFVRLIRDLNQLLLSRSVLSLGTFPSRRGTHDVEELFVVEIGA